MIFLNDIDVDARPERAPGGASRRSTRSPSSTGCCAATACRSTRWRRRNTRPSMPRSRSSYDPDKAGGAAGGFGLLARQSGQVHDPDHQGLQAQGLRDDPGHRRHVAQGRHRGRDRGLRDRQALRAARRRQAGAGRLLQLGQLDRRSDDLDRLRHVRPVARTRSGTART